MLLLLRLLLLGFVVYLVVKLMANLLGTAKPPTEVRGKSTKKPLDLSNKDIEDVDYKETKE
jgi:hypothetical protein